MDTINSDWPLILDGLLEKEIIILNELVMMPAGPVDVSVSQFLLGGGPDIYYLDLEAERFAGHLVIEVCRNYIAINLGDSELNWTLVAVCADDHAYFQIHSLWELAPLYLLDGVLVPLPISPVGCEGELSLIAHLCSEDLLLESWDHLPVPDQENQGILAFTAVELHPIYECPSIMHRCYRVLLYSVAHGRGPEGQYLTCWVG